MVFIALRGPISHAPWAVSDVVETFNSPAAYTTEGGGVIEHRPGGADGLSFKSREKS